jgi:hypothetical protein
MAAHESSGRIASAQRAFWDEQMGGGYTGTEWYRRLNMNREYSTEYISSSVRNEMPSWLPDGPLKFGDPMAQIKHGELRLPGRAYVALNPEVKGLDPEDYPYVHRLNILQMSAPDSPEFFKYKAIVEEQIAAGELNKGGVTLYNDVVRRDNEIQKGIEYDQGDGAIGSYYLGLKKFGRALPTESLYPFSPVHKFSGRADALTEYKSHEVIDNSFKNWKNPISDYIVPAVNKTIDGLSLFDYVPPQTQDRSYINSYFDTMQAYKNKILEGKASMAAKLGDVEAASYYSSGKRDTLYGQDPFLDVNELKRLLPAREQSYLPALTNISRGDRASAANIASPELKQILQAQWMKNDAMTFNKFDELEAAKKAHIPIRGMPGDVHIPTEMPEMDHIGMAPGVNLNALKVKTLNSMGKNLRDYNLWREDEKSAIILDAHLKQGNISVGKINPTPQMATKEDMEYYLRSIGMKDARVTATPTHGAGTVSFNTRKDNREEIRDQMRSSGRYSF